MIHLAKLRFISKITLFFFISINYAMALNFEAASGNFEKLKMQLSSDNPDQGIKAKDVPPM